MKYLLNHKDLEMSDFRVAAVLLFVILNLAIFFIRLSSAQHNGALFLTTGGEAQMIYSVWKGIHHLQVYEWPLKYPFSISLYNYLFYDTYAAFLRLAGAADANIMTCGCLLTPAFAILGAIAQWKLVENYLQLRGARSGISFLFALGLWFCTSATREWTVTIRPDLAAAALVMVALWIVVWRPRFGFAYAGACFYLAWSFKQSVVLAFVSVCLFLLFYKRWRDLSVLVSVFAVLIAATLFSGTPEYRFNILVVPRLVEGWSTALAFANAAPFAVANLYWLAAPVALLFAANRRQIDDSVRLLTTVLIISLAAGLVAMTKAGATYNYLFEAFVAGSTLLQIAVFTLPGQLVNSLVLFGCLLPTIQLATVPTGRYKHRFGTVRFANAAEYADAVSMRERLAPMKKPIFTTNPIFSLPWFSNDDRAPALVIEPHFYDATRSLHTDGGVEHMLQRGEIPTVMLLSTDIEYLNSLNSNYKKVAEAFESDKLYSIYSINAHTPDIAQHIK